METSFTSVGTLALLALGLVFGLKHATEVDHVVAVSTIVSEHRSVLRSALVGGLWGLGHTASLIIVGIFVLVFRVTIPLRVANWLEFGVALMIIALGVLAVWRVSPHSAHVHLHPHRPRLTSINFGLQTAAGALSIVFGLWYAFVAVGGEQWAVSSGR